MAKMTKYVTDSGLLVALNYFSHLTLCLSEKMRRCFKSFDIFEKSSDIFHSLAVTNYHYHKVRHRELVHLAGLTSRPV